MERAIPGIPLTGAGTDAPGARCFVPTRATADTSTPASG